MPDTAHVAVVGIEVRWGLGQRPVAFAAQDFGFDGTGDLAGQVVLDGEDVGEVAVVAVAPDLDAGFRLDQFGAEAHAAAGLADAAVEDVAHAEVAGDGLEAGLAVPISRNLGCGR